MEEGMEVAGYGSGISEREPHGWLCRMARAADT